MQNVNISLRMSGQGDASIIASARRVMSYTVAVTLWLAAMSPVVSVANAQNTDDLDFDGVPDVIDHDQDNDGISNALEGMYYLERLSDSPAQHYEVNLIGDESYQGSTFTYTLSGTDNDTQIKLNGRLVSSDTTVDWSMHDSLPKVRNLGAGSSQIMWNFGLDHSLHNIDMTISDLDGSRSETIVVSAASIVGYSLSLNSNIAVSQDNGKVAFVGTGSGGESIEDAVTLHFRQSNGLEVSYESAADHRIVGTDSEIAGFRHSFFHQNSSSRELSYFYPLAQFRDTDGDSVPDHRDLDSDNDGLGDVAEIGGIDLDGDNMMDGSVNQHGVPGRTNQNLSRREAIPAYSASVTVTGDDTDRDGLLASVDNMPGQFGGSSSGVDTDNDGLQDVEEIRNHLTDPEQADTDNDGLTDYSELQLYRTNPLSADTDGDGITDGDELIVYATDPTSVDSDLDGITDGTEIQVGTDPLVALISTGPASNTELADTGNSEISAPVHTAVEPDSAPVLLGDPQLPENQFTNSPSLRTGLNGAAGCTLSSSVQGPALPIMLAIASLYLVSRKKYGIYSGRNCCARGRYRSCSIHS